MSADLPSPAELEGRQYQNGEPLSESAAAAGTAAGGADASPSGAHEDEFDWEQVSTLGLDSRLHGRCFGRESAGLRVLARVGGWGRRALCLVLPSWEGLRHHHVYSFWLQRLVTTTSYLVNAL
jgi:hypothetical protein